MNPLQYLPVVGTIYRAATGDEVPETVRRVGSLFVSTLLGGVVGAAINIAIMAAEKISGIDLDHTGQTLLAMVTGSGSANHPAGSPPAPATQVATAGPTVPPSAASAALPTSPAAAAPPFQPWSSAQLAAYRVSSTKDDMTGSPGLSDTDVLNGLELSRIRSAQTAYGRTVALAQ